MAIMEFNAKNTQKVMQTILPMTEWPVCLSLLSINKEWRQQKKSREHLVSCRKRAMVLVTMCGFFQRKNSIIPLFVPLNDKSIPVVDSLNLVVA